LAVADSGAGFPPAPALRPTNDADSDEIDLHALWSAIRRRRVLALAVAATVLALGMAATITRRIRAPVYQGSFQLLVTDPISQDGGNTASAPADSLSQLAISETGKADTAVLSQVLRSTLLLAPVARRFSLPVAAIASRLTIADADRKAQGVLSITLQWHNPQQGQALLAALAG
jgi:succinoglycan biosynthesis transport protein ExoP